MKAAVLCEIGGPLEVQDVPIPAIGPDEVLIETRACGICRTDLHIQDGLAYVPELPHIPGHEPAGIIVETGKEVRGLAPGAAVVPHLFVFDRECRFTRSGDEAQATHLRGIVGVTLPGGFAEYFKVPARNVLAIPSGVPFDLAGLTSCAVVTAVHAFRKAAAGALENAAVIGAGGIGLILLQLLRDAGVLAVAVDRSPGSLLLARDAGAALALSPDDTTAIDQVRALVGSTRDGVDCVFELVGAAGTMKLAAGMAGRKRRIIVIGQEADFPAVDTITIAQRELEIIGSRNGGLDDARAGLDLMARGLVRPHIAERFPLDRINEAFGFVRCGRATGRVMITLGSSAGAPVPNAPLRQRRSSDSSE